MTGIGTMPRTTRNGWSSNGNNHLDPMGFSQEFKARLFLFIACLWPLWVLALFGASMNGGSYKATSTNGLSEPNVVVEASTISRLNLRTVLDRVDIMGYGPTHPRVAFVVVGDDTESIKASVESIFRNTDLNRIFLICAVLDGQSKDENSKFVRELTEMDNGQVPHWHGLRPDIHIGGFSSHHGGGGGGGDHGKEDEDPHSRKVHIMFHKETIGVAAARMEAVEFIELLEQKHVKAGIKFPEEDLILVLLQGGSQLLDRKWLQPVTNALIVPPPILRGGDEEVAMKLANAVSLRAEEEGRVTSFDEKLAPLLDVEAKASDINLSSGESYSTPAFHGGGIAMRLDTFLHLPAQDLSLVDPWPANLDLALNLWLCADGIDVLQDAEISSLDNIPSIPLEPDLAARFAAIWMDEAFQQKFFKAYSSKITRLDWETKVQQAKRSEFFPKGHMNRRCRSFAWYATEVNTNLGKILEQTGWDNGPAPVLKGAIKKEEIAEEPAERKEEKPVVPAAAENKDTKAEKHEEVQNVQVEKNAELPAENSNKQAPADAEQERKAENGADEHGSVPIQDAASKKEAAVKKDAAVKKEENVEAPGKDEKKESSTVAEKQENQHQKVSGEDEKVPDPKEEEHALPPPIVEKPKEAGRPKPKIPLRPENLAIIRKAQPVDIAFVPMDGGHKEHPHMGAKDEKGNLGYIHDETALRRKPPPFTWEEGQEAQACSLRDDHYKMMTKRVVVETEWDKQQNKAGVKRDKIFCLVYTTSSNHDKIHFIRETWGPKCDGFMVGSNETNIALGTVEIPHEGPEEYNNIWQKVRSMWSYIYDNYYEKYDWFHIGGDDLFLIMENFRYYLESEEIRTAANGGIYLPFGNETSQTPLFLGRRFALQGDMNDIFISGGAGYTMNKAAFKLLVVECFPNYFPHAHTFSEDTMVAKLLRKVGVYPYDTKDEEGGERYMPFLPGHHWGYHLPSDKNKDWYAKYSIDIKEGPEHCSPRSIAFHYVKDRMMKRLFGLAYDLCSEQYMKK